MRKNSWALLLIVLLATLSHADSEAQPAEKKKLTLMDLLKASSSKSQPTTTVQGVRGLEETAAGIDTRARDYNAIDRLDQVVVHDDELKKFVAEGNLK